MYATEQQFSLQNSSNSSRETSTMNQLTINLQMQDLEVWERCYSFPTKVQLSDGCINAIKSSDQTVQDILSSGKAVYGINTGFGSLSDRAIRPEDLCELQEKLILGLTVGTGSPLPTKVVRLAMALKLAALAKGYSGVRLELVQRLQFFLDHEIYPVVPERGSVGASGDLAPLAHIGATLIGVGDVEYGGRIMSSEEVHAQLGVEPLQLQAKEGLAIVNGTQISTALALAALFQSKRALDSAIVIGALTTEALLGLEEPFDPRIHAIRRQKGQIEVAKAIRELITGSGFRKPAIEAGRRQDPYSVRCQPQILGACSDIFENVAQTLALEADAVTDNPLIFPDTGEVLSGGNFHAEPVAFAADEMALALCEIGGLSERRLAMMTDPSLSRLPPFLTSAPGLNSGFMGAQIACAALVAENRQRSHPASVDSVPTVANMEDYVSMATHGARRLLLMTDTLNDILTFELLGAVEGCDHRGLALNPRLEAVRAKVRSAVPRMNIDRHFAPAHKAARILVSQSDVAKALSSDVA